ncbi:MAG: Gfo/Idh/MocA family protein, partial [Candidatus Hinthialibacter sp.]
MSRTIKWGVIGSGGIARRRTIPEGIIPSRNGELSVVFDLNADVNQSVAQEFHAAAAASLDELLKADIDAVYIASPAYAHFEHVQQCAQAGKHVLCEKPLGLNVEEAETMIETCRSRNVLLGTALMMRFHSQHQAALNLIQQGKLGKPVYGRAQLSCWYPPMEGAWRQDPVEGGGGSLIDMGGHCIDLLEMFLGPVKKASCFIHNNVHSYTSEDSAAALLFFESGAMASVDAFFCIPDASSKNMLELYGSQGSILAQGTIGQGQAGEMIAYLEGGAGYDALQKRSEGEGLLINP